MVCPIVTSTLGIIQAVRDLNVRLGSSVPPVELPENLVSFCGDGDAGLIAAIEGNVLGLVEPATVGVTETVDRPDEVTGCGHTGTHLTQLFDWIEGIVVDILNAICSLDLDVYVPGAEDSYYSQYYYSGNGGFLLTSLFNTFLAADRLVLSTQDDVVLYDSGCISTGGFGPVTAYTEIPVGTTSVRVEVYGNCAGQVGFTSWTLVTRCSPLPK